MVPLVLFGMTLFSIWRGIGCGCFGSLPFLSQFSFGGHLLLLLGMFFGLYYLTASSTAEKVIEDNESSKVPHWTGLLGIAMMAAAFLTLPFTSSNSRTSNHLSYDTVDRTAVEAAIANHSAVIIDARPELQYAFGHIPTARA